jgi:hypothetical protein
VQVESAQAALEGRAEKPSFLQARVFVESVHRYDACVKTLRECSHDLTHVLWHVSLQGPRITQGHRVKGWEEKYRWVTGAFSG